MDSSWRMRLTVATSQCDFKCEGKWISWTWHSERNFSLFLLKKLLSLLHCILLVKIELFPMLYIRQAKLTNVNAIELAVDYPSPRLMHMEKLYEIKGANFSSWGRDSLDLYGSIHNLPNWAAIFLSGGCHFSALLSLSLRPSMTYFYGFILKFFHTYMQWAAVLNLSRVASTKLLVV